MGPEPQRAAQRTAEGGAAPARRQHRARARTARSRDRARPRRDRQVPGGMTGPTLITIGYEKARLADVVTTLRAAGVATLIDVRDRPQSRRPGFSRRQLEAGLAEAGIRYVGLKALGTPH